MSAKPISPASITLDSAPFGHDRYESAAALGLIGTDHVTPATRRALAGRLRTEFVAEPTFLASAEFACLTAVVTRLVPQDDLAGPVDLAGAIDRRLSLGEGDGWRYDAMPPDGDAFRHGLQGIDATSRAAAGAPFADLPDDAQDEVLRAVQAGQVPAEAWAELEPRLFFEELLAAATEFFYADPRVQASIGYAGFADAHGWRAIGLDERERHEPVATGAPGSPPA